MSGSAVAERPQYRRLSVTPTSAAIGAQISCGDLRQIDADTFSELYRAWLDHCVVVIRGQTLDALELVTFSRRFGALDFSPTALKTGRHPPGAPEIIVVTNTVYNGVSPAGGLTNAEAFWHTDMSYVEEPPKASLLYSLEIPPVGGDTGFANMYLALETLPGDLRETIQRLEIKHDASHNSAGILRPGRPPVTDVTVSPGPVHPICRTHPESGRDALYLGRRGYAYIPGLSVESSEALLDRLWAHATRAEFTWHHQWKVGDLIIWDNRCAMHRRDPFDANTRRVMFRTQVNGDRPFNADVQSPTRQKQG